MLTVYDTFEHWASFEGLMTLEELGVLDRLRGHTEISVEKLSEELSLDKTLLHELCVFVSLNYADVLIVREGMIKGGSMLDDAYFNNQLNFAVAYKEHVHDLPKLLKGEAHPTGTSSSHGHFLSRSSEIYSGKFRRSIVGSLERQGYDLEVFVDLGCGSGALVNDVQKRLPKTCVFGIDQNPDALQKERVTDTSMFFIEGDVANVEDWATRIDKRLVDSGAKKRSERMVISLVTVLHEFTRSEEELVSFVQKLRKRFTGATLVVAEQLYFPNMHVSALPMRLQNPVSFYQLIHHITGQGSPKTHREWHEIFRKNQLEIISAELVDEVSAIYWLKL